MTIDANGTGLTYTPDPGFTGKDLVLYNVTDASGNIKTGTVILTVKDTGGTTLGLSDLLTPDDAAAGSPGGRSGASHSTISMASGGVDLDTLVHQAHHHVG